MQNQKQKIPLKKVAPKKFNPSLLFLLGAIVAMLLIQNLFLRQPTNEIPYSEFKQLLNEGKIKELKVSPDRIVGVLLGPDTNLDRSETGAENAGPVFSTLRVADPDLVKELQEKNIKFEGDLNNDWWQGIFFWVFPILLLFVLWGFIFKRMNPQGGLMSIGKSKAKIYMEGKTKISFKDVAGIDEAVEEVKEVVEFLKNPDKFKTLGGQIPKGVLLVGPPGTGKTLLARAVAGEASVPFFSLSGSDFVEMFVGVGASRVRDLFQQAASQAPCIVFIDELDALGKARGINPLAGHDEREQTLNQLLSEMDGFEPNTGVIIMAATNRPEILDMALLRPGRFDRQIVVDRPDINGREAILNVHAEKVKLAKEVDLRVVAARTPGFAGADLANIINEAALLAARFGKKEVMLEDLEEAIDRVIAGLEKKSRVLNKQEKEIVAYHESGHAIVGGILSDVDKVHRVSIIPRGVSALGYTLHLPTEERYLNTKTELLNRIKMLLGGRVAEEITFKEISNGAYDDLRRATAIARSMVMEYGMSEKLGPLSYSKERQPMFLDPNFGSGSTYSEKTAAEIDTEVRQIVEKSYKAVKTLLRSKKKKLETLAKMLLEKEVVEGEELETLLKSSKRKKTQLKKTAK